MRQKCIKTFTKKHIIDYRRFECPLEVPDPGVRPFFKSDGHSHLLIDFHSPDRPQDGHSSFNQYVACHQGLYVHCLVIFYLMFTHQDKETAGKRQ